MNNGLQFGSSSLHLEHVHRCSTYLQYIHQRPATDSARSMSTMLGGNLYNRNSDGKFSITTPAPRPYDNKEDTNKVSYHSHSYIKEY